MKRFFAYLLIRCWCLVYLLDSSKCTSRQNNEEDLERPLLEENSTSSPDRSELTGTPPPLTDENAENPSSPAASSSFSTAAPRTFLSRIRDAAARIQSAAFTTTVRMEMYCKDNYSAEEVEKLLSIDTLMENWWIEPRPFSLEDRHMSSPMCSAYPNAEEPTSVRISSHDFFRTRHVHIVRKAGRSGTRLNKYEHLNQEPLWRKMLECNCQILRLNHGGREICVNGKIVNLSRGVGGDTSFFVHAPNASGSYKVVAHICFPLEWDD